jgi:hypothetical protein
MGSSAFCRWRAPYETALADHQAARAAAVRYALIITSASRAHLLRPTLQSLLAHVDVLPQRIFIHNDAAFHPGTPEALHRWLQMKTMLAEIDYPREMVLTHADPPRRLGLALWWLLRNCETEYVLYSQDDFVTVRPLPLRRALAVMEGHGLHQIRFNKRATLGQKDTWKGVWRKEERSFALPPAGMWDNVANQVPLTVADHWYFQTSLWRVQPIKAVVAWCTATPERTALFAKLPAEEVINQALDGCFGPIPGVTLPESDEDAEAPAVRARVQRTFIWGPIGEDRYIRHIGVDPADWTGEHPREPQERREWSSKQRQAWAEIAHYQRKGLAP